MAWNADRANFCADIKVGHFCMFPRIRAFLRFGTDCVKNDGISSIFAGFYSDFALIPTALRQVLPVRDLP